MVGGSGRPAGGVTGDSGGWGELAVLTRRAAVEPHPATRHKQ